MSRLAELDQVAYVRFASVYRDFTGVKDFESFIARLAERQGEEAAAQGPDADIAAK
jgi:transcriptional regulator NrdR family protein